MQSDSSLPQEPQSEVPISQVPPYFPVEPQKKPNITVTIILAMLLALLILTSAGLGYWVFQSNKALIAAQGDLATLQGQHADLTAQRDSVSSELAAITNELDQVTNELEQNKSEITATENSLAGVKTDVEKANNELADLKEKMENARVYIYVMVTYWDDGTTWDEVIDLADEVDSELGDLLTAFREAPNYEQTWLPFATYLLSTVVDILEG